MKTLKNFIMMKTPVMKMICIFISLVLFTTCEKIHVDPFSEIRKYDQFNYELPLNFSGYSRFDFYANEENRLTQDGESIVLNLNATLIHKKENDYILETEESMPLPDGSLIIYRKIRFDVEIMPGGAVKFSWPETWVEYEKRQVDIISQLFDQTGCSVSGPCIDKGTLNFEGSFDGINFYAKAEFMGKQVNHKPEMVFFQNIDGPVKFEFSFSLEIQKD